MNISFTSSKETQVLFYPLTFLIPIHKIRIGILTIEEKWKLLLDKNTTYVISPTLLPDTNLIKQIKDLDEGDALFHNGELILQKGNIKKREIHYQQKLTKLKNILSILDFNTEEIFKDFDLITKGRISSTSSDPFSKFYNP